MAIRKDISQMLEIMARANGREIGPDVARMIAFDLESYPADQVMAALTRCRREVRGFPCVADIISRIDDGHPGVEEAWAMLPMDESASVVWTPEISEAFGQVRHMIEDDPIAARMAFREIYSRKLGEARDRRIPAQWSPSLGFNPAGREAALRLAERKGRLESDQVNALLPDKSARLQLVGPCSEPALEPMQVKDIIRQIRQRVKANGGENGQD